METAKDMCPGIKAGKGPPDYINLNESKQWTSVVGAADVKPWHSLDIVSCGFPDYSLSPDYSN